MGKVNTSADIGQRAVRFLKKPIRSVKLDCICGMQKTGKSFCECPCLPRPAWSRGRPSDIGTTLVLANGQAQPCLENRCDLPSADLRTLFFENNLGLPGGQLFFAV